MSFGSSLGAFAEGFAGARQGRKDSEERAAANARQDRMLDIMEKNPGLLAGVMGSSSAAGAMGALPPAGRQPNLSYGRASGGYGKPSAPSGSGGGLFGLLGKHEGAGNYDTLYGHSQNEGGRFAGVRPSQMTLDQLDQFEQEYGPWVAARNNGVLATPVGIGQIVGTTRRAAAKAMGLTGDTVFSPEVQTNMVNHLAQGRLRGVTDPAARRAAIRKEWVGFKNVPDADLDIVINEITTPRQVALGARPPAY